MLIAGVVVLVIASVVHSYCAVSTRMPTMDCPAFFYTVHPAVPHLIYLVPLVTGMVLLFLHDWIAGLVGLAVYWFIMPLLITPIMKKWMLPSSSVMPQLGHYRDVIKTQVSAYKTLKNCKPTTPEDELLNQVIMSRMRALPRIAAKEEEQAYYAPLLERSDKTLEEVIWAIVGFEYVISRRQNAMIKGQELGLTIDEVGGLQRDFETSVRQEIREILQQERL